ncbi:hypothetical protein MnTg03_00114 [bacterium MnTg03]|nr:hypothetical protein MnTg03_00114 [bacterium MnTg03]
MRGFKNTGRISDIGTGRYANAANLCSERIGYVIAI